MPKAKKTKVDHAHRALTEKGEIECACGERFETDNEWRAHYEKLTTAKERARLEGRNSRARRRPAAAAADQADTDD